MNNGCVIELMVGEEKERDLRVRGERTARG